MLKKTYNVILLAESMIHTVLIDLLCELMAWKKIFFWILLTSQWVKIP